MYNSVYDDGEYDYWIVYEVTFVDGKVIKTNLQGLEDSSGSLINYNFFLDLGYNKLKKL